MIPSSITTIVNEERVISQTRLKLSDQRQEDKQASQSQSLYMSQHSLKKLNTDSTDIKDVK
jgi:hypothetical protein